MFQLHNTGEGSEVHSHGMMNRLCRLVKMIIRASPVQDPHPEQAKEHQIVDISPNHLLKPFHPSDHIGPKPIIKEEVQVHVPPPTIMDDCFVVRFPCLPNAMKGVLGNLQFSVSISIRMNEEGNYLVS